VKPGIFITLEGIEGSGKSTLAKALHARLTALGRDTVLTREPGGTPLAEQIRALVLTPGTEPVSPVSETLLMFAARALHIDNLIRPALARGAVVICDRFTDATRCYQGAGRGVACNFIEAMALEVHAGLNPQVTFLLDLPPAVGRQRSQRRGGLLDRFEAEHDAFFTRVRAAYLALAAAEPQRFVVLDAGRDAAALAEQAWSQLTMRL
jgi:dTMP kinase